MNPEYDDCPDCKGEGVKEVDTLTDEKELVVCTTCDGRGWVTPKTVREFYREKQYESYDRHRL